MTSPYRQAIAHLDSLGVMPDRPPSLEPVRAALDRLGLLERADRIDPARVVIVAGTNGKGSTSAALEALLVDAGQRVGLYTSPHLAEITERFRIDGADIAPELFTRLYHRHVDVIRELRLSHFEALTVMAASLYFSGDDVPRMDWTILEVGLGGLWDATNAIPHQTALITALGHDHQNLLGSSLTEIARNKLGVVPAAGGLVVHQPFAPELAGLVRETAARTAARFVERPAVTLDVDLQPSEITGVCGLAGAREPRFIARTRWGAAEIALSGERGAQNVALALAAFAELGFDPREHLRSLARIRWAGRMQRAPWPGMPCPVYLSGDHNPQGIASLLEVLQHYPRRRLRLVVGVGRDKDLQGVLEPLFTLPDAEIHLTETPFRGRAIAEYGPWLARARSAEARPQAALARALQGARADEIVVVTGSLYLVGDLLTTGPSV